jgi:TRAP-type C4-dicarboxylate transport system permease small subunit
MHQTVARGYALLLRSVGVVTAAALVLLVVVVSAAVVVRYFGLFGGSLHWATELSRFTIVWVAMLGSVVAFNQGAHLAIALFQEALPPGARRAVEVLAYLLSLVFILALAWSGFQLSLATMRQISPALGLPMGYAYLGIPVGATVIAIQSVLFAIFPDIRQHRAESGPGAPAGDA